MTDEPKHCARCEKPRLVSDAYCLEHRREYRREWFAMQRRNLKRLRAMVKGVSIETMDSSSSVSAGSINVRTLDQTR